MRDKKNKQIKGMVDIGKKEISHRVAKAYCNIKFSKKSFGLFCKGGSPKGDVLETAKIAGIMAAKNTSLMIPMCHPLLLNKVDVIFNIDKKNNSVEVFSEVVCDGKTGVEMEALVAASTAALTIYDMMKWADKGAVISNLKLIYKSGGKSGIYKDKL